MSKTWISLCEVDSEETMSRFDALEFGIIALDNHERNHLKKGNYELAGTCNTARIILERMRDENEEQA